MVERSLAAAAALADEGIDVEVIDLRTLHPMDIDSLQRSVEKTGRLVTVEEQPKPQGWGNAVIASLAEAGVPFKAPPVRIALPDIPLAYSPGLEDAMLPGPVSIAQAIRRLVSAGR
jgi:pyruvate dehydrogenase E1 component beta subunit